MRAVDSRAPGWLGKARAEAEPGLKGLTPPSTHSGAFWKSKRSQIHWLLQGEEPSPHPCSPRHCGTDLAPRRT